MGGGGGGRPRCCALAPLSHSLTLVSAAYVVAGDRSDLPRAACPGVHSCVLSQVFLIGLVTLAGASVCTRRVSALAAGIVYVRAHDGARAGVGSDAVRGARRGGGGGRRAAARPSADHPGRHARRPLARLGDRRVFRRVRRGSVGCGVVAARRARLGVGRVAHAGGAPDGRALGSARPSRPATCDAGSRLGQLCWGVGSRRARRPPASDGQTAPRSSRPAHACAPAAAASLC